MKISRIQNTLTFLIFLLLFCSSQGLLAEESKNYKKPREHDGFLFRYMVGYATGKRDVSNIGGSQSFDIKGNIPVFLDFGGAINDYVSLHAGLRYFSANSNPSSFEIPAYVTRADYKTTEISLDFGASFYIMPAMVFFRPTINIASSVQYDINIEASLMGQTAQAESRAVFTSNIGSNLLSGYGLTIGKEWWVVDELALGLALFYQVNNTYLKEGSFTTTLKNNYYGLLFTVTYN